MAADSFAKAKLFADGLLQQIAVNAAPILTAFTDMVIEGADAFGGLSSIVETSFAVLAEGFAMGIDGFNLMLGAGKMFTSAMLVQFQLIAHAIEKIQDGLNYIAGTDIDLGISDVVDFLDEQVEKGFKEGSQQFQDGFKGTGGQAFRDRLAEINNRAFKDALEKSKPPEPPTLPPIPTVPQKSIGETFQTLTSNFFDSLATQANKFEPAKIEPTETKLAGAVSLGNAQSTINSLTSGNGTIKALKVQTEELQQANSLLQMLLTQTTKLVGKPESEQVSL
ncbi:MAG: hypothetical protein AAFN77_20765 [Planctomycetota bacterium]